MTSYVLFSITNDLDYFYLLGLKPSLLAIVHTHLFPLTHGIIDNRYLSAFVQNKEISTILSRRALHIDSRPNNDSSLMVQHVLLLLIGEDIACHKKH